MATTVKHLQWRRWAARASLLLVAGGLACGDARSDDASEQTSTHFRYVAQRGTVLPEAILQVLEAEYRDFSAVLSLPNGTITYRLVKDTATAGAACGRSVQTDCALGAELVTTEANHYHELVHAFTFLRFHHFPSPLLTEGVASLIGCLGADDLFPLYQDEARFDVDWSVAASMSPVGHFEPYVVGRRFTKFLIGKFGWERFWAYYDSDNYTLDSVAFQQNFESFFALKLDDVWTEMRATTDVISPMVCPCSAPSPSADGSERTFDLVSNSGPSSPFLYDAFTGGDSGAVLIQPDPGWGGSVGTCNGSAESTVGSAAGASILIRGGGPWRLSADHYRILPSLNLDVSCSGAALDVSSTTELTIATGPREGVSTERFVRIHSEMPRTIEVLTRGRLCSDCSSESSTCTPLPGKVSWTGDAALVLEVNRDELVPITLGAAM